jgi:hypothetical protein
VSFSNGTSVRGGIGGRVGTSVPLAGTGAVAELSLLGKLWNEFGGNNSVTVTDGVNTATYTDQIGGVFGEVQAAATVYSSDRSLSGFVNGDAKFGDEFTTWGLQAGVRKNF